MFIVLMIFLLFLTACQTVPEQKPLVDNSANTQVMPVLIQPEISEAITTPAFEKPQVFTHTIRYSGETLGLIAAWYIGSASAWPEIAKANPELLPNQLRLGDVIVIPEAMLKNKNPMTEAFVAAQRKAVTRTSEVVPSSETTEGVVSPTSASTASKPLSPSVTEKPTEKPPTVTKPVVPLPLLFGPREG